MSQSDSAKTMIKPGVIAITIMILVAALFRFLPTPPNFAPVAAMALFGGAYFADRRLALLIPLAIMIVTDLVIGLHSTLWAVYLSFVAIVGIGILISRNRNPLTVISGALGGSLLFFLVTNFAVWLIGSGLIYPKTLEGLLLCYTAAIPFFHNTIIGDLVFTGALFGGFELFKRYSPQLSLGTV